MRVGKKFYFCQDNLNTFVLFEKKCGSFQILKFMYKLKNWNLAAAEIVRKSRYVSEILNTCLATSLGAFTTDSTGQLDILGHDCNPLGVDSAQVGVFEEANQVSFRSLLQSSDGSGLEPQVGFEVLSDFTDKTLERQLADQQFGRFLVPTDFSKSDSSGPVTMRLFDAPGGRGRLTGCLGGQLFSGSLSSGRLSGGLLGTS